MSSNTVGYACDTHASIATDGLAPGGWNDGGGSKIKGWDPWHGIRQQVVKRIARSFSCPAEFTLQVLGGKWKVVILYHLKIGPLRYADLRKMIPAVSDKVLSHRLHELIEAGVVERGKSIRSEAGERAEVYALSARGQSLGCILTELCAWGETNASALGVKVGHPQRADGLPG